MSIAIYDSRDQKRQEFFDRAAEGWEDRHYSPELQERVKNLLVSLCLPRGLRVLDAGCGRGVLIPYLREILGPEAGLTALDSSAAMLKGAAEKDPLVKTIQARCEEIPLPDAGFGAVICFSCFPHIHDKAAAAAEFCRVLEPGGTAYIIHLCGSQKINMHHDDFEAVRGDHLPGAEDMKQLFLKAGFQRASLEDSSERYLFAAVK
ncbi:MAG: class I SAM-dependent methyltransferase [Deltaproteobacteria bacterium]|jgi:ubiquinone/menaquinone biosynthesis C-methylase UbiE|nr:class I SAM-dependent methyltransferase [Deltaproteobacteria bacterium]